MFLRLVVVRRYPWLFFVVWCCLLFDVWCMLFVVCWTLTLFLFVILVFVVVSRLSLPVAVWCCSLSCLFVVCCLLFVV